MKRFMLSFAHRYLDKKLDLRVRLFNVLAIAGATVSAASATAALVMKRGAVIVLIYYAFALLSVCLMEYARRSGKYQRCYTITIAVIFLIGFPAFFFMSYAYYSGMPYFFIFAIVFTVFMLEGKRALMLAGLELAVYVGLCMYAHYLVLPADYSIPGGTYLFFCVFGFSIVSIALGLCMFLHFRLYNEQQRQLAEQNRVLSQLDQMKTEIFANVSHEMKTPLTVISVHIQRAEALLALGRNGDAEKIHESFTLAQDEIMRMSRLVNNSLTLVFLQGQGDEVTALDIAALLNTTAETYRALIEKQDNMLILDIPPNMPAVRGAADRLIQLFSNLLANAAAHTNDGEIRITAVHCGENLIVTVADSGVGIPPDLLPQVFERGVSGGGSSGLGLPICREIAEAHDGSISVESIQGRGTTVTVTLPVHQREAAHGEH